MCVSGSSRIGIEIGGANPSHFIKVNSSTLATLFPCTFYIMGNNFSNEIVQISYINIYTYT